MYSLVEENRICCECENWHHSPNQTETLLSTVTGSVTPEAAVLPLGPWQNFYVIVGTAAATLTGLMFVVITLIAQIQARIQIPSSRSHITVFSTSNVVHFGAVLLAAGILSAPWPALWPAAWPFRSGRDDIYAHRALAGTPPSELSTGVLRLAMVYGPCLLRSTWSAVR
jgi:hypothetical protein